MSKRLCLVQRIRLLQIATMEDNRILKTDQNLSFLSCPDANITPLGSRDEICDLSSSILIACSNIDIHHAKQSAPAVLIDEKSRSASPGNAEILW